MALYSSIFFISGIQKSHCFFPVKNSGNRQRETKRIWGLILTNAASNENVDSKPTKLVTFLGKGGSGKTTASIFAAQHYAMSGLKTCLVVQSQDPTPEYLLNCKIGPSPVKCDDNLSAVRLETTKMMLGPLKQLKQADARLNMTQGVLEGVVGEELGILPGMDSIFAALELERLVGVIGGTAKRINNQDKFDMVVFDGISTEETFRMFGATGKLVLYLKYLRNLAEKTDLGRVASPSILRLLDEALTLGGGGINLNGKTSPEIWNNLEQMIKKGSSFFSDPRNFGCYIVMDPTNALSKKSALRYWGCAIQAGINISGAFGMSPPNSSSRALSENIEVDFSPLPFASIPRLNMHGEQNWKDIMVREDSKDAIDLLSKTVYESSQFAVKFDPSNKSVTLFMPGFDKSEIKLYQFRGGSELLVDAGDQRRVICLPSQIQGKVGGAKFIDRSLIITMR